MRQTKIVCTIGPASESRTVITKLVRQGMNIARLNLSHGTLEEHRNRIHNIRAISAEQNKLVSILLDIQGPKIRTGLMPDGSREVEEGELLAFSPDPEMVQDGCIHIGYDDLLNDIQKGSTIFLDDGLIELVVERVESDRAFCRVVTGGTLKGRKGVSLPGVTVGLPALTTNDLEHLRFGVEERVDYFAASFVRKAEHVRAVEGIIRDLKGTQRIVAKIENAEGVANMAEIVEAADAIMVARGDMGVELPPEDVPVVQKRLIKKCNEAGKPVITATQMLDSMARSPRPTRAEATDVANAIFDGTDAVMLSGETAVGRYPVRVVEVMDRIAHRAEAAMDFPLFLDRARHGSGGSIAEAIARATSELVQDLRVRAILCSTQSGATARLLSKYRPKVPIIALTPHEHIARHLMLAWGVHPFIGPPEGDLDAIIDAAIYIARQQGIIETGDTVAIVAGVRTGVPGSTNLLQVYTVTEEDGEVPWALPQHGGKEES